MKDANNHSIAAEQAIIGGLILDNKAWPDVCKIVTALDFSEVRHQTIFRAIGEIIESGGIADMITINNATREGNRGFAYIGKLAHDTPTAANVLAYAQILADYAINRGKPPNHHPVLDDSTHYCKVNLLRHVDNGHLQKRLSIDVAKTMHLPESTVFLMGLAVFSSIACRRWVVNYPHYGALPIGLNAIAEQPSGTSKTRLLKLYQRPFITIYKRCQDEWRKEVAALKKEMGGKPTTEQEAQMADLMGRKLGTLFITNATPEALENTLKGTNGFFSAVSSEQGLFNSLLGKSYGNGRENNNDILLNGYDGGNVCTSRITREGYTGDVVGGVVLFAQQGSIETILDASNGTGLSERFLMLAEQHSLGKRDHRVAHHIDDILIEDYARCCNFTEDIFGNRAWPLSKLFHLNISPAGWKMIADYRNSIEPYLADGGRYAAHISIRGAAGKVDMTIMKIAANLHLLDDGHCRPDIDDRHVKSAIGIAGDLLEAQLSICKDKGLIGARAEFTAILRMFDGKIKPLSEREIIQSRKGVAPFKGVAGNSDLIKKTLLEMVMQGLLLKWPDEKSPAKFLYSMAQ